MRPVRVEPTTVECVWTPLPGRAWGAVVAALIVAAALTCLLVADDVWLDPARLAPIESYALNDKDSTVFALARARSPARAAASVVLLGSSAARESLWDETTWREQANVNVSKLTSSGQTPIESLFLLEQQALRPGQLVVLSIGVSQLDSSDKGARLRGGVFLQSPSDFAQAHPDLFPVETDRTAKLRQTLLGARRLLVRYVHTALPRQVGQHVYGTAPIKPRESFYTKQVSVEGLRKQKQDLQRAVAANGNDNLRIYGAAIDAIAQYCSRYGARLVVLETPHLDSDLTTTFAAVWRPYVEAMQTAAKRHGVQYINMSGKVALTQSDYIDVVHLGPRGRDAWSRQLVHEIAVWRAGT